MNSGASPLPGQAVLRVKVEAAVARRRSDLS